MKSLITVDDFGDVLPLTHKINEIPDYLPESLYGSIENFIIVCSIRRCRGGINSHNSMINFLIDREDPSFLSSGFSSLS